MVVLQGNRQSNGISEIKSLYGTLYKADFGPFKLGTGVESALGTAAKSQNRRGAKADTAPRRATTATEDTEGRTEEGHTNCKRLMLELRHVAIPQARLKVKHVKKTVRVRKRMQADSYERVMCYCPLLPETGTSLRSAADSQPVLLEL